MKPTTCVSFIAFAGVVLSGAACAKTPSPAPSPSAASSASMDNSDATAALAAYIKRPDSSFAWKKDSEKALTGDVTLLEVMFTSQTWQGIPWKHHLSVLKPKEMKANPTALLYITGNYHPNEIPIFAPLVAQAKQPLLILWDTPNQPLFDDLNEDALISYTFVKYLETHDATWPLLFPMTKGAVRAMDTAEALAKGDWKTKLSGFVVTGASKRGWTTWLTGASDKRVKGIAPMVFDNLNFGPQMRHQIETWGQFSEQIQDYTEKGLQKQMETETGQKLTAMVDPYNYRRSIRIPKLLINGTNDRYWTVNSSDLYFKDLVGPKDLLYVPNSGHGLEDHTRVLNGISAFWGAVSAGKPFPQLRGEFSRVKDGADGLQLMIQTDQPSTAARIWWATSDTKDFRNSKWEAVPTQSIQGSALRTQSPGVHWLLVPEPNLRPGAASAVAALYAPPGKYAAMFGEVEYKGTNGSFTLSTQVGIIGPEKLPASP